MDPRPTPLARRALALIPGCLFVATLGLGATTGWLLPAAGAAPAAPAGDAARGKALYAKTCVSCHGAQAEGKRELSSPALHTQEPWYLVAQLQKFRDGLRGSDPKDVNGAVMRPMAQALPDAQSLMDLASYISAIEGPASKPEVKGDVAAGAVLYKKTCAVCHGDDGKGKPDVKSPALVGQNDWYIVMQLQKFKQGLRGADPKDVTGAQMRAMATTLTSEQSMKDVAAYLASLK